MESKGPFRFMFVDLVRSSVSKRVFGGETLQSVLIGKLDITIHNIAVEFDEVRLAHVRNYDNAWVSWGAIEKVARHFWRRARWPTRAGGERRDFLEGMWKLRRDRDLQLVESEGE